MGKGQLDERRLQVLSRLRDGLASEADKHRQLFQESVHHSKAPQPWYFLYLGRCIAAAVVFRYLQLQSDRLLRSDPNIDPDDDKMMSFADVKDRVLSIQELSDWKICTVPVADKMPVPLAIASALIPILGVGLHNGGVYVRLDGSFKVKLARLIESIEKES